MKVILIEDELPAIEKLSHFLQKYDPDSQILGVASSIADTVPLLTKYGEEADLLLVDVQLEDGLSFQALDQVSFFKPVIFITAHSQYALEAFQANGIDYLVKPIRYSAFQAAMDKFQQLSGKALNQNQNNQLWQYFNKPSYKDRFMVKIGEHIHTIPTASIRLFNTEGRNTYLFLEDGKKFITDYKMESLEEMLDPTLFFRVNRSFMVHLSAIKDVLVYSNSRLKINPNFSFKEEIIVSRDRVNRFKEWLGGTIDPVT
ncbi:LytR/AlgR family response regulator transcription factor [Algoriphagus machipongonensis]|uniref:Two-component system response regulator n=1 Tax=Algoriphagus machipongonensis TaxID=388413 RepID=A3I031_9BACT|nr:LytTR family DNA-binding domain-containing protein [Algoriphagus machipongonensis]EAZ79827.1 two-component system response regulator [Algoriphagus machipongonensis]